MSKLVCHAEKLKMANVQAMQKHNERENRNYSNECIDRSRSEQNIDLLIPASDKSIDPAGPAASCQENSSAVHSSAVQKNYLKIVKNRIAERSNPTGKALRKDAVVLTDFVISSDRDFFEGLPTEEIKKFFTVCRDYLSGYFDDRCMVYATVHMDETTPHMHIGFVPITKDSRLCAKEILTRENLRKMQSELPKVLQEAGFRIERGIEGNEIEHKSVREFKSDQEKELQKLKAEYTEKEKGLEMISHKIDEIRGIEKIQPGRTILGDKLTLTNDEYLSLKAAAEKSVVMKTREKELQKENRTLKLRETALQKQNIELEQTVRSQEAKLADKPSILQKLDTRQLEEQLREIRKAFSIAAAILKSHGLWPEFQKRMHPQQHEQNISKTSDSEK